MTKVKYSLANLLCCIWGGHEGARRKLCEINDHNGFDSWRAECTKWVET